MRSGVGYVASLGNEVGHCGVTYSSADGQMTVGAWRRLQLVSWVSPVLVSRFAIQCKCCDSAFLKAKSVPFSCVLFPADFYYLSLVL